MNNKAKDVSSICSIYLDIFGTDQPEELRAIARKAREYDRIFGNIKQTNIRDAGRKKKLDPDEIDWLIELYHQGKSITFLAEQFSASRQTIYKYLESEKRFEKDPFLTIRMEYLYKDRVCTIIDVDFFHKRIYIRNKTNDILHRAFGVIETPTWEDFDNFLKSRCFPESRSNLKLILDDLGIDSYDPLQIIEKTEGRMAEDMQWIRIHYREEVLSHGICRFEQRYRH